MRGNRLTPPEIHHARLVVEFFATLVSVAPLDMDYQVVFDITSAGYKSWSFDALGIICIVIGGCGVAINRKLLRGERNSPGTGKLPAFIVLGFAAVWTLFSFDSYRDYRSLVAAVETGAARVAEGGVSNFTPMPVTGHAMEKFCVGDACFEYSDFVVTNGFNNTSSHGGPIRDGRPVRITYVGNSIVKLEVQK